MDDKLYNKIADLVIDDLSLAQILDYFGDKYEYNTSSLKNAILFMEDKGLLKFYRYEDGKRVYSQTNKIDFSNKHETKHLIAEQTNLTFRFYNSTK